MEEITTGLDVSRSSSESPRVSISIVSHRHGDMISRLLSDLQQSSDYAFEIIVTVNIPERTYDWSGFKFPVRMIHNEYPKGFGANHNTAFNLSAGEYFAVVNPDIRLRAFVFNPLIQLFSVAAVGAVAPLVLSSDGSVQDSARKFPSWTSLARKALRRANELDYVIGSEPISVDWVAGMFILFRRQAFAGVHGFDERYFLYYEDVDICTRLRKQNWSVILQPATSVEHDAQRASHRQFKYLRWHAASAARYLFFSKYNSQDD